MISKKIFSTIRKTSVILTVTVLFAYASEATKNTGSATTASYCSSCAQRANGPHSTQNQVEKLAIMINPELKKEAATLYSINESSNWVNPSELACESFTNKYGLSIYGRAVVEAINRPDLKPLLEGKISDMGRICPNYNNMTLAQKQSFWVLLTNGMAYYESRCENSASGAGPNGTVQGLFQLHKGREHHYVEDKIICPRNASLNAKDSINCTMIMIKKQVVENGLPLFPQKGSYWQVLMDKSSAKPIQRALIKYCEVSAQANRNGTSTATYNVVTNQSRGARSDALSGIR